MPQRRLDAYFHRALPAGRQRHKSFLDLPFEIRHKIYIYAGLVRFCPINLNQEGLRDARWRPQDRQCFYIARKFYGRFYGQEDVTFCQCPRLPLALFHISHSICEEVTSILYSENTFTIARNDSRGLKPLRNLSRKALQLLQSLTIRLNNCSCTFGHSLFQGSRVFPCHELCQNEGLHDRPIGNEARQHKDLMQEWFQIARNLASSITPGRLRLSLVSDTKDFETACEVIRPLSDFPMLKDCSVRLHDSPKWEFINLGRSAVTNVRDQPRCQTLETCATTRSLHIPEEILELILGYTEIIAPFDLEWRPGRGLVPFDCCKMCTDTLDCCCCSFYHSAYSSRCTCWRLPVRFFLVNHAVRRIAMSLFYSRNKFVLLPRGGTVNTRSAHPFPQSFGLSLLHFIKRLPSEAHPHLRRISVVLPGFDTEQFLHSEQRDLWEYAISLLHEKVEIPRITLILEIDEVHDFARTQLVPDVKRTQAYHHLIAPIIRLQELTTFFIFVTISGARLEKLETMIEKCVIGNDYDAQIRGKSDELRKAWYNGWSLDGPVFAPDGREIWPPASYFNEDAY